MTAGPVAVYLQGLAPGSRRVVRYRLDTIARLAGARCSERLAWHALSWERVSDVRAAIARRYRPATARAMMCALRGVLRTCWRLELLTSEQCERLCDHPPVRGQSAPAGRRLQMAEVEALIRACRGDESDLGTRDTAIIVMLYGLALRRAELVALHLTAYDRIRRTMEVPGKGAKVRRLPMQPAVCRAVDAWLELRGSRPGALVCQLPVAEEPESLTGSAVYAIVRRRHQQAGIRPCSPHDLRRTTISELMEGGADATLVAAIAGHESLETTRRYTRYSDTHVRSVSERLQIPEV